MNHCKTAHADWSIRH